MTDGPVHDDTQDDDPGESRRILALGILAGAGAAVMQNAHGLTTAASLAAAFGLGIAFAVLYAAFDC